MLNNQMEYAASSHPPAEAIESYALASVRDQIDPNSPDVVRLEEHLLWCGPCLRAAEEEEAIAQVVIDGLLALRSRSKRTSKTRVRHAGQL